MQTTRPQGFDTKRYLDAQIDGILDRVERCGDKLYLEFGGKLLFDYHATRVLPGYQPNAKVTVLQRLRDKLDILFCVNAKDIASGRIRGDFGITYDLATLRSLDDLSERNLPVTAVIITRFKGQKPAVQLKTRLERRGMRVYTHASVAGYPNDVDTICSAGGFGVNEFIETTKPIVAVSGAGPGSGKIETALHQMWHTQQQGGVAGFAKWETFPVWDISLDHPLNIAYEAATADLKDVNVIDPWHLEAYGVEVVNYNRDVEHFKVLAAIVDRIRESGGKVPNYRSPTDMCINRVSHGITDDSIVSRAARQELIRRWFRYHWEYQTGVGKQETMDISAALMERADVSVADRPAVVPAREAAEAAEKDSTHGYKGAFCGAAIELPSGTVVTGKNSQMLYSTAAAVLNAIKRLAGIPDSIHLLSPLVIHNLVRMKKEVLGQASDSLDISEALAALSVSAAHNPAAEACFKMLSVLKECEMHMTHVPTEDDQEVLRKLGIMFTTDARFTPGGYFLK